MKANDNLLSDRVHLPLPPELSAKYDMDVYARFMRHLRLVANSRMEIKVLSAIQFVADMMDTDDAEIARILVDLGLRAPRVGYPASYLEYADNALMRDDAPAALHELREHWGRIGEDRFAAFRRHYPTLADGLFTGA